MSKTIYYFEANFDGEVHADSKEEAENNVHQLIYDKVRNGSFEIKLQEIVEQEFSMIIGFIILAVIIVCIFSVAKLSKKGNNK